MHARKPLPSLLPPARLIFLRPLLDGRPHKPAPLVMPASPAKQQQAPAKPQNGHAAESQLVSLPRPGSARQPASGEQQQGHNAALEDSSAIPAGSLDGSLEQPDSAAQSEDDAEAGGSRSKPQSAGKQQQQQEEQWDAVWLQPKQLLDEGLLLSSQWRRHHSGPAILAALGAALSYCST